MKQYLILSMAVLSITLFSCTETKNDGEWDDNIKLSLKSAEFNATGDSVIITTGGDSWWITDITVNESRFTDFSNVNQDSDSYSLNQDCFSVEKRNKNTIAIKANSNNLNTKRIITVGFEAGDYFDRVTITQKSN